MEETRMNRGQREHDMLLKGYQLKQEIDKKKTRLFELKRKAVMAAMRRDIILDELRKEVADLEDEVARLDLEALKAAF